MKNSREFLVSCSRERVKASRKGKCWDNAVMERVWQKDYANHAEAMNDIADYIVSFHNSQRLHSKLGNLPPNAFEQKSAITQPIGLYEKT